MVHYQIIDMYNNSFTDLELKYIVNCKIFRIIVLRDNIYE